MKILQRIMGALFQCPGRKDFIWRGESFFSVDPRSRYCLPHILYKHPDGAFQANIYVNHLSPSLGALLIKKYFDFDPRVAYLVKFILYWAKIKSLLNPTQGYFSSYALILLIIFFLQIQAYPVLDSIQLFADTAMNEHKTLEIPSFRYNLKKKQYRYENWDNEKPNTETVNINFMNVHIPLMKAKLGYPKNTESLGELLVKFFYYYGVDYPVITYLFILYFT